MRDPLTDEERRTADDKILAMGPRLTEACKDWRAFLSLPWEVQRRLRELQPQLAAELKRRYFGTGSFGPGK